jgi:intracellular septation protein
LLADAADPGLEGRIQTTSMKILLDFLPILLFFGAYKFFDIYVATGVLMAATALQMTALYLIEKRLQTMHKITLSLVLAFGLLTLLLHDERFIKWKPTVLYAAMAIGLAIAVAVARKNFLKAMLGSQLDLPDAVWMRLNWAWILYCAFMSLVNGYVAAYYSTADWVNFKLWGYVFPLTFIVCQGLYVARHMRHPDEVAEAKANEPNS